MENKFKELEKLYYIFLYSKTKENAKSLKDFLKDFYNNIDIEEYVSKYKMK